MLLSTYPLLIQFHELVSDLRSIECQAQTVDIKLRQKEFQYLFEGQATSLPMLWGGRHYIFQDGAPEGIQLYAANQMMKKKDNKCYQR